MKYANEKKLKAAIVGFLNQRQRAARVRKASANTQRDIDHWTDVEVWAGVLKHRFDSQRNSDYWRYCLEVVNQREKLLRILPGASSGHKQIRTEMEALMAHCHQVASQPKPATHAI